MGKIVSILIAKTLLILINTLLITFFLYRVISMSFFSLFTAHERRGAAALAFLAFSSAIVIFMYSIINNKIAHLFKNFQPFIFLFLFSFVYYFIYFALVYFGYLTLPLCFVMGIGARAFNKELKYILLPNIVTLIVYVILAPFDSEISRVVHFNSFEMHYLFSLTYFGVFYFFLLLFNITTLAN
jgi:hypothetical protein